MFGFIIIITIFFFWNVVEAYTPFRLSTGVSPFFHRVRFDIVLLSYLRVHVLTVFRLFVFIFIFGFALNMVSL